MSFVLTMRFHHLQLLDQIQVSTNCYEFLFNQIYLKGVHVFVPMGPQELLTERIKILTYVFGLLISRSLQNKHSSGHYGDLNPYLVNSTLFKTTSDLNL